MMSCQLNRTVPCTSISTRYLWLTVESEGGAKTLVILIIAIDSKRQCFSMQSWVPTFLKIDADLVGTV